MPDLKQTLKTTDRYIAILNSNGIFSLKDFFNYFPRTHEDRQNITTLGGLSQDVGKQSIKALVTDKKLTMLRSKKKLYEITFEDEDGQVGKAVYFGA